MSTGKAPPPASPAGPPATPRLGCCPKQSPAPAAAGAGGCNTAPDGPGWCRAAGDIRSGPHSNGVPMPNLAREVAVGKCAALCCATDGCDAWAFHWNYTVGWASGCLNSTVHAMDCCLLKTKGWHANPVVKGDACVSGGRSSLPPPPPPPTPPSPPPPTPRGGGGCATDWDCSLGGECTAGACVCDPQYTGANCAVLRLRRAKPDNGIQSNPLNASLPFHTWGGHAIHDTASGKYVGFFSYMAGGCGLSSWTSASMIISAVADAPDGPYNQRVVPVTAPWTHNAMISQHPNGSYYLFHIGTGVPKSPFKPCVPGTDPLFPFPAGHPEPPPAATHVSESLSGPWRSAGDVPALNNPCPFFFENGTTLLFDRTSVHWAASIDTPSSQWQSRTVVSTNGSMVPEDPGVWRDARGNFHMLINANSGHGNCQAGVPCGGHLWSTNGLDWSRPVWPAFGTIVHYTNGSTTDWSYVERPQVVQGPDGTPVTLFLGQNYKSSQTLAIMFCQAGDADADCVTTIN